MSPMLATTPVARATGVVASMGLTIRDSAVRCTHTAHLGRL